MPGTYVPLAEWCDTNQHRQFPLTDDATGRDATNAFQLPQTLLVDLFFCVPPADASNPTVPIDESLFYLHSLLVRYGSIDLEFGYNDPVLGATVVGRVQNIPAAAASNEVYYLAAATQSTASLKPFEQMAGAIVIGSMIQALDSPGYWEFDPAATALLAARINTGLAAIHTFQLGASLYAGNVVFKEGDNVTITPSYDGVTLETVLTFSAQLTPSVTLEDPITDNDTLIAAVRRRYGQPVTTINSLSPDTAGNFTLTAADCTSITSGTYGVSIGNPCSTPCCSKAHLTSIYDSLSELNQRYARMESYYESLSRNVNALQALLVAFEL